jgi:hypothetical protein
MQECQPKPELLDFKIHRSQERVVYRMATPCSFLTQLSAHLFDAGEKSSHQLSIFPTATLPFVILT